MKSPLTLLAALCLLVPAARAEKLEQWLKLLPKNTLGFLAIKSAPELMADWEKCGYGKMLADEEFRLEGLVQFKSYKVSEQNVVGVKLPFLDNIDCEVADYSRLSTPPWVDTLVQRLKDATEQRMRAEISAERLRILTAAVRRITQRVNLFDKILIPTAKENIQKIRIFLGDAERASVITSKLAKKKQQQQREAEQASEAAL